MWMQMYSEASITESPLFVRHLFHHFFVGFSNFHKMAYNADPPDEGRDVVVRLPNSFAKSLLAAAVRPWCSQVCTW